MVKRNDSPIRRLRSARFAIYFALQLVLILSGALITATLGSLGTAIGTSMIATGAGGIIVFAWVVFDEVERERRAVVESFGFVTSFPYRSIQIKDEYRDRTRKASRNIDVMGYGLNSLREDFLDDFEEWAARLKVRVLLVDTESPKGSVKYVDIRDMEEENSPGRTRAEVLRFIDDTYHLWSQGGNFQLRLARTLPSINMFRIDDESFWGPYLISSKRYGRASRNLPTMIVRRPGYMYERLVDHFDEIWSSDQLSRAPNGPTGKRS
jgi:hypothetical protein